jgi:hypothetical protein
MLHKFTPVMNNEWTEAIAGCLTAPVTRARLLAQEDKPLLFFDLSEENFSFCSLPTSTFL